MRLVWTAAVMFIAGVALGKVFLDSSWPVSLIDGVILAVLFTGAFWLANRGPRRTVK